MRATGEGQDVMLAERGERDVLDDHHLLVSRLVELAAQVRPRVLLRAAEDLLAGARHAVGRSEQPLAVGVLADGEQELADGGLNAGLVDGAVALGVHVLLARRALVAHARSLPLPYTNQ